MDKIKSDRWEQMREQYDKSPYPKTPLEKSPLEESNLLYIHNLVTSYYIKNQQVIDTKEKIILDAGCGSGWKSLLLASANPGAKIVGIDISEVSVKLSENRLKYWGFDNIEFHLMSYEDLPNFGQKFDYINCDNFLYILPDTNPAKALKLLKSVLKPEGIIRANLHSKRQRHKFYQAQELFKFMGLMDENPREMEIEIVQELFEALKDKVDLKASTWIPNYFKGEAADQNILMNYLLIGDKGYTIPEMLTILEEAELELLKMVDWQRWQLNNLFQQPDNLPTFLALMLAEASEEDKLHIYELLNPIHRLLDFWCTHPQETSIIPVSEWQQEDWEKATIHLHPQLKTNLVKEKLINCLKQQQSFEITAYLPLPAYEAIIMESSVIASLLPLWESPQSFKSIVQRWLAIQGVDLVTLEPKNEEVAFEEMKNVLINLEKLLYVLITK